MLMFSQRPTHHSRIGNSLVWMSKYNYFSSSISLEFCFPWAVESYKAYLSKDSAWIGTPTGAGDLFEKYFNCHLSAANLYKHARLLEDKYEVQNNLKPYEWNFIRSSFFDNDVLLISGVCNLNKELLSASHANYKLIIVNEPFNVTYNPEMSVAPYSWAGLEPRSSLMQEQRNFINSVSKDRRRIGLHIRRGDYADWRDGKYFFKDEYWINLIKTFDLDGSVIWIFSNDLAEVFKDELIGLGCEISKGDADEDFIRLMCMDEVFGPPSSYSTLAVDISKKVFNKSINLHVLT